MWRWALSFRAISNFRIYKWPQVLDVTLSRERNIRGSLLSELDLKRMAITCLPLLFLRHDHCSIN